MSEDYQDAAAASAIHNGDRTNTVDHVATASASDLPDHQRIRYSTLPGFVVPTLTLALIIGTILLISYKLYPDRKRNQFQQISKQRDFIP